MPIYSSSDSDNETAPQVRLFSHQMPVRAILGGGKVADLLLWRNPKVSAALFVAVTSIWFLFEVVEYHFVTLFCHVSIIALLVVFIWGTGAEFFNWNRPEIPKTILHGSAFEEVASAFHKRFNRVLSKFHDIACGRDPANFFVSIASLYILSVIGNYFSFINLLFLGFLSLQTLPYLYERYQEDVDKLAGKLNKEVKKTYKKFDSNVLNKIPRKPVKDKKTG
ncbi:Reticulon domain-containing protein [Cephalotus follicularis]|uniref:Reticulon-like protein n=1 Tax=Cephalotus follicularis TaxID=3775 RepID=A0A1Q3CM69_CEPFO|nr:Reticulon domain-containing protein [Cephalotus follicularis]